MRIYNKNCTWQLNNTASETLKHKKPKLRPALQWRQCLKTSSAWYLLILILASYTISPKGFHCFFSKHLLSGAASTLRVHGSSLLQSRRQNPWDWGAETQLEKTARLHFKLHWFLRQRNKSNIILGLGQIARWIKRKNFFGKLNSEYILSLRHLNYEDLP